MVKPAPVSVADVIFRVAFPVFFRVTVCEPVAPMVTLPNVTGEGVAVNCEPVLPEPEREIVTEISPLSPIVIEPLDGPPAVGANFTVNTLLFPALKVKGTVSPVIE